MQFELEVSLRLNDKTTLFGKAPIDAAEFIIIKHKDRWDLDKFLRTIAKELTTGVVEQVYLRDEESITEKISKINPEEVVAKGNIQEEVIYDGETRLFTSGLISPEMVEPEKG